MRLKIDTEDFFQITPNKMDPLYNIHLLVSYEQKISLHKTGSKWKVSQQTKPNSPGDEMAVVPTWRYSLTFF